jgi:photosystem II stability/assembly factor-like uncharacterized protein
VSFDDANNGTYTGSSGAIFRTTNGGAKWNRQVSGTTLALYSASFPDVNTGTAVGEFGTILHTTDAGKTWTTQTSGTVNRLSAVSFSDAKTGTIGGDNGIIFHTTDEVQPGSNSQAAHLPGLPASRSQTRTSGQLWDHTVWCTAQLTVETRGSS